MNKNFKNVGADDPVCPKDHRGITLIALIVTIIVLLILAGVSLNLVSGSDGILGRATKAVSESDKATAKEQVELFVAECMTGYYMDGETGSVQSYIESKLRSGKAIGKYTLTMEQETGTSNKKVVVKDGTNSFLTGSLQSNGSVIWDGTAVATEPITVAPTTYTLTYNAGDGTPSKASDTLEAGDTITFATATRSGYRFLGWYDAATDGNKITYATMPASDTEIYAHWSPLIASQITSTQYGMETNYEVTVNGVTLGDKTADVTDADASLDVWKVFYKDNSDNVYLIYGDYLPASCVPQAALDAGLQKYTTDTSKPYAIYGGNVGSTEEENRDAMVSALGTASNWNGSFGKTLQGKTITATGAPTMEQLQASYGTLDLSEGDAQLDNTKTNYSLYVPHTSETQDCHGYWLASPDTARVFRAGYVSYDGAVHYYAFGAPWFAARPVVCLPSGISGTITGTTLNIDAK